jgi:hypothetical protein
MPGNPLTDPHWPAEIADTVERLVGKVRDLTTNNLVLAARALVFGILAFVLGMVAIVMLMVGLSRGLQSLLDLFPQRHHHRLRPRRAHRRHLHRPGQPRPARDRG